MGGHGGLNILPQKKWNIYNYDNRLKIERDKAERERKRGEDRLKAAKGNLQNNLDALRRKKKRVEKEKEKGKGKGKLEVKKTPDSEFKETETDPKKGKKTKSEPTLEGDQKTFREWTKKNRSLWYKKLDRVRMKNFELGLEDMDISEKYGRLGKGQAKHSQLKGQIRKAKEKRRSKKKRGKQTNRIDLNILEERQRKRQEKARKKKEKLLAKRYLIERR